MPTQKEIDKFKNKKEEYMNKKKELLKQIEDLDNLIYLNEIVLQTYLKHQKNYYYIINVLNLYNNNINNNIISSSSLNNEDDDFDDVDIINRCSTINRQNTNKSHYSKRRSNLKNDYDFDSKDLSLNNSKKNIMSSFKRAENNRINSLINSENKNNNKRDKKYINYILTNIVKNKEKKDGSVIKEERRSRYVNRSNRNENDSFKDDDDEIDAEEFEKRLKGKKRVRHCSQDIRTKLDLQQGN
jgi:hypothetical protein